MYFDNITNLSVSHQSNLKNAGLVFSRTKILEIDGILTDLTNAFGISGIWHQIPKIKAQTDFTEIIINGINFGTGRVSSLSFSEGNDVRTKRYNASIEIQESGDLAGFAGIYYTGINVTNIQFLNNIEETYDFQKTENGGYSYSHNANINFSSGLGNLNAIESAKLLAKSLFTGANLGFGFYSGYTNRLGKRYYQENYDLIDNTCSFSESFSFNVDSGTHSATQSHSFELNQDGIINVTENATINGIENPVFQNAVFALTGEKALAYSRCSGVFSAYTENNTSPLLATPVSDVTQINAFDNVITYTIQFTNNPTNSGLFYWNYTHEIAKQGGVYNVSENGQIQGRGAQPEIAFKNSESALSGIQLGIYDRVYKFYTENSGARALSLDSKTISFSPVKGECSYGYNYNDGPFISGSGPIKKITIENSNTIPLEEYNVYGIINYKEIIQKRGISLNNQTENIIVFGKPNSTLQECLASGLLILNEPNDSFITDASYSYNSDNKSLTISTSWSI